MMDEEMADKTLYKHKLDKGFATRQQDKSALQVLATQEKKPTKSWESDENELMAASLDQELSKSYYDDYAGGVMPDLASDAMLDEDLQR